MLHQFVSWLEAIVAYWGYGGVVALMAVESSFFPFPSEIVVPPAAYLAATGKLNLGMVILCGTIGSLLGAIFNYWIALKLGRPFLDKYGKYLWINSSMLAKAEIFFQHHGHISTFIGRLLPGIRQYISLPAGLARMNFWNFCAATTLAAGLWVLVLAGIGFWFGRNRLLVSQNLHVVSLVLIMGCTIIALGYRLKIRQSQERKITQNNGSRKQRVRGKYHENTDRR